MSLNLVSSWCSEFSHHYVPQGHGCEEILEDMNQTGLLYSYVQETKDNQKNNFQSVWPVHPCTILSLKCEDDRQNVNTVNCSTADDFSQKLANTENTPEDKNMCMFHLEHWISLIVQSNWFYLVFLNRNKLTKNMFICYSFLYICDELNNFSRPSRKIF